MQFTLWVERVNFAGTFLEARGLFSLRNGWAAGEEEEEEEK